MEEIRQGYKQTDIGVIPEEWKVEPIGNLLIFKNGLNKSKEFFGYGTPIVNYMDVYSKDSIRSTDIQGRVHLSNTEILRYEVKAGDVFFTRTSETPEEVGISSVVVECPKNTVFSGFVLRGRPINTKLTNEFKSYCFQTKNVRSAIIQSCTYTTRALTNGTQLSKILIPIPNESEQSAIATALSDTDALIAALDKKIAKKQQIKQGVMQQLLTGKKRLPGFSREWKTIALKSIIDDFIVPMRDKPKDLTGEIPWCRIEDFDGRYLHGSQSRQGVDKETIRTMNLKVFPVGTLLVSCSAYLGRCAIVAKELVTNQTFIGLVPSNKCHVEFLFYIITREEKNLNNLSTGTTISYLSREQFENYELLMPSEKSEQIAISQILNDIDNEIVQLQKERDKTMQLKAGMMQVLLTGKVRLVKPEN